MGDGAVIVTGGSRGIGAALSVELDRRGFKVACLSRTGDAPLGCEDPSRFLLCVCDATDEVQLRERISEYALVLLSCVALCQSQSECHTWIPHFSNSSPSPIEAPLLVA